MGYDTLYWRGTDDATLVRLTIDENRLLLTRDTRLPHRLSLHRSLFIDSDHYDEQLRQVFDQLGLPSCMGHRCLRCNLLLQPTEKAALRGRISAFVWQTHERFARCPGCLRIYWEGTHYARMLETLDRLPGRQTGVAAMKKENGQCA